MANGKKRPSPPGYGAYKAIHQWRHPGVVMLSEKGYKVDPWRAMEIAIGLKPKPVVQELRRHKQMMETGKPISKKKR